MSDSKQMTREKVAFDPLMNPGAHFTLSPTTPITPTTTTSSPLPVKSTTPPSTRPPIDTSEQLFFAPASRNSITSPRARQGRAIDGDAPTINIDALTDSTPSTVPTSLFGTTTTKRNPNNLFGDDDDDIPISKPVAKKTETTTTTNGKSTETTTETDTITSIASGIANITTSATRRTNGALPTSPTPLSTVLSPGRKDIFSPDAPEGGSDRNLKGLFIPNDAVEQHADVFKAAAVDKDLLEVESSDSLDRFTRRGSEQKQQPNKVVQDLLSQEETSDKGDEEEQEEEEDDSSPIVRQPVEEELDDDLFALAAPAARAGVAGAASAVDAGFDFSSYIAQNTSSGGAKLFDD